MIVTGALHFDPRVAFDFPPGAFKFSLGFSSDSARRRAIGIYDYLGYYDICYIGDEVRDPGRVIPRSILISVRRGGGDLHRDQPVDDRRGAVARVRAGRRASRVELHRLDRSWRRIYGRTRGDDLHAVRAVDGVRVGLRAAARLLAHPVRRGARRLLLPRRSARLHPTKDFPARLAARARRDLDRRCSFFSLGTVIDALITTRILVQFMGQVVRSSRLRRARPDRPRPFYRMWLYPGAGRRWRWRAGCSCSRRRVRR